MTSSEFLTSFAQTLLDWAALNPRVMPWNETRDPYKIWLSEIILQQTQVNRGIPYFLKFVRRYPTVYDLASASEEEVLKVWQGLGYNSRARNLRHAAIQVVGEFNGVFPDTYAGLITLPGVGSYTAAAIASFAFGRPIPVIDSNVLRVMCRFLGLTDPVSSPTLRKHIQLVLNRAIINVDPAAFNQAIMNFGAMQCVAWQPSCTICPLALHCVAHAQNTVDILPARKPRIQRRNRFFHYMIVQDPTGLVLRKRVERDIWQGMFDFPLIETQSTRRPAISRLFKKVTDLTGCRPSTRPAVSTGQQLLTHQRIHCTFYTFEVSHIDRKRISNEYRFAVYENLSNFAVPKIIDSYLRG